MPRRSKDYDLVLCVSDMHFPYNHPDLIPYLTAIKKKYWQRARNPLCLIGGDELDWHSISFHDIDPSLPNASRELEQGVKGLKKVHKIFKKAIVLESNHGSLVYRKQKHNGLPIEVFKTYNEYLDIPTSDWTWVKSLTFTVTGGETVYACHGKASDITKLSRGYGVSAVQFHYHEKYKIEYWSSPKGIHFAMQCGCLIDDGSKAFDYNKLNLNVPIIGIGLIVKGKPILEPMVLDKQGRWVGHL